MRARRRVDASAGDRREGGHHQGMSAACVRQLDRPSGGSCDPNRRRARWARKAASQRARWGESGVIVAKMMVSQWWVKFLAEPISSRAARERTSRASTHACAMNCSMVETSTRRARPRSSLRAGGVTTTRSGRTYRPATSPRRRARAAGTRMERLSGSAVACGAATTPA
jgi:hypothetical protein